MTVVESTCLSSKGSSKSFSSWVSHLEQRLYRTNYRTNFLCVPILCNPVRFSHRITLTLSLLQHYFYFETVIHLFSCTDSSRKGSMKKAFHQHSLYEQESGDELGLDLVCFLVGCFGFKTLVFHFHFVLETLLSVGYTPMSCPYILCYVGPLVSHS